MINRVRNTGWQKKSKFTSAECTDLDKNTTYAIDKRDGYSDTISSSLTFEGNLNFESGSDLVVDNADSVQFESSNGNLVLGTTITGAPTENKYFRFGVSESILVVGGATTVLSESQYVNPIIKLTGSIRQPGFVSLPSVPGAIFYIDNQVELFSYEPEDVNLNQSIYPNTKISNGTPIPVYIDLLTSVSSIRLQPKQSGFLFIDQNLRPRLVGVEKENDLVDIHYQGSPDGYGMEIKLVTPSDNKVDGYVYIDENPVLGDQYDVSFNCMMMLNNPDFSGNLKFTINDQFLDYTVTLSPNINRSHILSGFISFKFTDDMKQQGENLVIQPYVTPVSGSTISLRSINFVVKKYKTPQKVLEVLI